MATDAYFVPTDADGTQHLGDDIVSWPLPKELPGGLVAPGEAIVPEMGTPIVLRTLDGVLDDLGERIFVAEVVDNDGPEQHKARLVSETAWNLHEAARFALDCAEHATADPTSIRLPSGSTVAEIFSAARRSLDEGGDEASGLMQRISRLALARRLRRLGDDVADFALTLTSEDEAADLDALDDPDWSAVAAIRDAVLSATEAIRHDAFPRIFESGNRRYESDADMDEPPQVITTPWGEFTAGARAGVVPAWIAARDAAERARQAVTDAGGEEAGAAERSWQVERLARGLGL